MLSGTSIELKALGLRLESSGAKVVRLPTDATLASTLPAPNLLLCDLANDGALDAVERFYGNDADETRPHLVTLGMPRGDIPDSQEVLLGRARHRFRRPLDIQAVADEVLGTLQEPRPSLRLSQSQTDQAFAAVKARSSRAPRLSIPPLVEVEPSSHPSSIPAALTSEEPVGAPSRHLASPNFEHSVVSPELEALLAEAERRVQAQVPVQSEPSGSIAPARSVGHLSDDLWDALAEPLDEDVDNPVQEGSSAEVPPPSPLAKEPSQRSMRPPGEETIPPDLWKDPVDEDTGSHPPVAESDPPDPESEQTSGSLGPSTAAGHSDAPVTLAPGLARGAALKRDVSLLPPSDGDGPATQGPPEPPSTTPPAARTRMAETRSNAWSDTPHPLASAPASSDSDAHSSDHAPGALNADVSSRRPPAMSQRLELPGALVRGASALVMGRAVRQRFTGCLAFEVDQGLRRIVFKEGDLVIAASAVHGESLVSFLVQRGDLASETAAQIEHRIPVFGRHAGAALIARGLLEQGELWPVLRSHAEWVLGQLLLIERGAVQMEYPVPERLAAEPAVFGGATGAEVLLEAIQRAVPPAQAMAYLGSDAASLVKSGAFGLLSECALSARLTLLVKRAQQVELSELLADAADEPMLPCVLHALCVLDVLKVQEPQRRPAEALPRLQKAEPPDRLDDEALRARVQARRALVDEGDYFALLGVPRQATGYDIRRSYVELRRQFDPGQVLRPNTLDLEEDVDTILEVLDEAYDILRDQQRRERYRRAIESVP